MRKVNRIILTDIRNCLQKLETEINTEPVKHRDVRDRTTSIEYFKTRIEMDLDQLNTWNGEDF